MTTKRTVTRPCASPATARRAMAPILAVTLACSACAAQFPRTIPQPERLRSEAERPRDPTSWSNLWRFEDEIVAVVVPALPVDDTIHAADPITTRRTIGGDSAPLLATLAGMLHEAGDRWLELRVEDRAIWRLAESEGSHEVVLRGGPRIRLSSVRRHADDWIVTVSRSDVRTMAHRCGHHGQRGALIGAAAGFASVFLATGASSQFEDDRERLNFQFFFGSLLGAVPGGFIGHGLGSRYGTEWCTVYQHPPSGNP